MVINIHGRLSFENNLSLQDVIQLVEGLSPGSGRAGVQASFWSDLKVSVLLIPSSTGLNPRQGPPETCSQTDCVAQGSQ